LRQPLESGESVIARANHRISYPSRIQLVAAMNPCRCGHASEAGRSCKRGPDCRERYQARVSGPMLDRIDLQIEMPAVLASDLALPPPAESSADVRRRVVLARERQAARFLALGAKKLRTNAEASGTLLELIATPDEAGLALLRQAADTLHLSARGYHRTLKVARTLADLEGAETIGRQHIAEALAYRGETMRQKAAA
ncbi:MAG: ATP-binding protein, partial [Hyphomicrobiaceae bacterium]